VLTHFIPSAVWLHPDGFKFMLNHVDSKQTITQFIMNDTTSKI